ncbi:MAG: hypothetical protein HY909_29025 [Deltaproteobacteria bacterium]|nr:hypothetical protein [Deltaproteobacteria bacterium]
MHRLRRTALAPGLALLVAACGDGAAPSADAAEDRSVSDVADVPREDREAMDAVDAGAEGGSDVLDDLARGDAPDDLAQSDTVAEDAADEGAADAGRDLPEVPGPSDVTAELPEADARSDGPLPEGAIVRGGVVCAPGECRPILLDHALSHLGNAPLSLFHFPGRRDAFSLWAGCLAQIAGCLQGPSGRRPLSACLDPGTRCQARCTDALRGHLGRGAAALEALDQVFFNAGAPCAAP